jgi:hypothetical protein
VFVTDGQPRKGVEGYSVLAAGEIRLRRRDHWNGSTFLHEVAHFVDWDQDRADYYQRPPDCDGGPESLCDVGHPWWESRGIIAATYPWDDGPAMR